MLYWLKPISQGVVIVVAYVAAHYGLSLLSFNLEIARNVSIWFLPGGLLFGCLMVARGRYVGWVIVGDVVARSFWSFDLWSVPANMGWLTIVTISACGGYWSTTTILKRIGAGFQSSGAVMWLIIGMVLTPSIIAPLMCLTYASVGFFHWENLPTLIPSFLIGDLVGIGSLAPLIMAVGSMKRWRPHHASGTMAWWPAGLFAVLRTIVLPALSALVLFAAFHTERPEIYTSAKFLMFIPLTVVALREGWRGAAVAIVILNFSIVLALAIHQVPLAVIDIQLLLLSYSIFALTLGVVIEERRDAQQMNELLSAAVHSSQNALGIIDLTQPEQRFLFANDALVALSGRSSEVLRQTSWRDLHRDYTDHQRVKEGTANMLSRQPIETDIRLTRINGDPSIVRAKGGPVIDQEGRQNAYLITYIDITEEKRREQIEREREKLISLGHLASGVAHELNNLIHPIINFAKLAGMRLDSDPARVRHYLDGIRTSGLQAGEIVQKILLFARPRPPTRHPVPFGEAVRGAVDLIRTRIPPTVSFVLTLDDAAGLAPLDGTEVSQVITNLILNAAHAVAKDGQITITVSSVALPQNIPDPLGLSAGAYLRLDVADNGHGMNEETRRRIFEPFYSTKPIGEGTGLGLSVVYGLITRAGGAITIESEVGKGTEFSVYLPKIESGGEK